MTTRIELKVPPLPESVTDATVLNWYHQAGERVERDEKLVDLETDKVVLEVPAPKGGTLMEINKQAGDTVHASDVLGLLDTALAAKGEGAAPAPVAETATTAEESGTTQGAAPSDGSAGNQPGDDADALPVKSEDIPAVPPATGPAVRRLIEEHALDPSAIPASGPRGRLTKGDVLHYLETLSSKTTPAETETLPAPAAEGVTPPEAAAPPNTPASATTPTTGQPTPGAPAHKVSADDRPFSTGDLGLDFESRPEQRVPMTRLRQRIAERLIEAQQTAAILTTFNEVDMQAVMDLRKRYKTQFEETHGSRLGFMSFFVKAVIQGLKQFPNINASVDGGDIVYHGYYDIGIAVSSPRGLVVPILRDADGLSFAEIESGIGELAGRARDGKLQLEDLTGGTFSITNGGVFGSLLSTPILNPPQSAILGMHKIQQRPMAVDDQIVIRPMMYLALSYDHRLIDGSEAVRFLVQVKQALEDPARLLLQV